MTAVLNPFAGRLLCSRSDGNSRAGDFWQTSSRIRTVEMQKSLPNAPVYDLSANDTYQTVHT